MNYFGKLQFSLIYSLYKTKSYKAGGGYRYRANQFLSFSPALCITLMIKFFTKNDLSNNKIALIFLIIFSVLFFALEKNTTRYNMFKYRFIYKEYKKQIIPFFIFIGTIVFFLLFLIYFH